MKTTSATAAFAAALALIAPDVFAQAPTSTVANPDTILTTITRGSITITTPNPLTIPHPILGNDTDTENDPLTILNVGTPLFGKTSKSGNTVIYTPNHKFKGTDSFTYEICDRANGLGNKSSSTVTIRNPFLLGRGTYASSLSGMGGSHDVSGYFNAKVSPSGEFTSFFRFAGKGYRLRGRFDLSGNYTGEIARGKLPPIQLSLLYAVSGNTRQISGTVTFAAETIQFVAPIVNWTRTTPAPAARKYTAVLPAPNTVSSTPQGHGFSAIAIGRTGTIAFYGRTGDNRGFSSSTFLGQNGTAIPVYGIINSVGSIYGTLNLAGIAPRAPITQITASGNLRWFSSKNVNRTHFPNGFDLTIPARASAYIEPLDGSAVLDIGTAIGHNSNFTASAGDLRTARAERSTIRKRPAAGAYEFTFDNARRLSAQLVVVSRTGGFSGSFYDTTSKRKRFFKGVFIQSENKAFGIWKSETKTGKIDLVPDSTGT